MLDAPDAVALGNARDTIAQLEPLIKNRSASARQRHEYWDALDVVRRTQAAQQTVADEQQAPTMSYAMPNPMSMTEFGKVCFTIGGVIILIAVAVALGSMLFSAIA